jgi:hypothetical protein
MIYNNRAGDGVTITPPAFNVLRETMIMETTFNVNEYIKVRLTDRGRKLHKDQHDRTYPGFLAKKYPYQPPQEDKDGWSRWQAWHFMASFGAYMGCGSDLCCETEIKFTTA